jgi:hypothetical protein
VSSIIYSIYVEFGALYTYSYIVTIYILDNDGCPADSVEDFQYLKDNYAVDFSGKICLTRYGNIFRWVGIARSPGPGARSGSRGVRGSIDGSRLNL